jgi:hypothetical protein
MKKSTQAAVETYVNGNYSDFKAWLKRASKLDILDAIEYHQEFGPRHSIINSMRNALEN